MIRNITLVLAPHTDDESMGAGGLMARWRAEGRPVYAVAFSAAPESLPEGFERDATREEFARAMETVGLSPPCTRCLNEPVRRFPERRQAILEEMLFLKREVNPDVVVIPSAADVHQDHRVIHEEAIRAFKQCTILAYEPSKNAVYDAFRPTLYVPLGPDAFDKKIRAIQCYQSQLAKDPEMPNAANSLASLRGYQIGETWAEAYEVIRWIL